MEEYGDLVELGIEGVDRITDKYHDTIYGTVSKAPRLPFGKNKHKNKERDKDQDRHQRSQSQQRASSPEYRDRSERRDSKHEPDYDAAERRQANMYTAERRREREWDADTSVEASERIYYNQSAGNAVARRGPPAGYDEVARRAPSPPADYGRPRDFAPYGEAYGAGDRGRLVASRTRSYSYSPRRRDEPREREREERHERKRSTSPNHHRTVATIVGALAGGAIGSRVKKGEGNMSTLTTVAGAVIGGIAAREGEKMYDRYKEERYEREEREEQRAQRRREREHGYGY